MMFVPTSSFREHRFGTKRSAYVRYRALPSAWLGRSSIAGLRKRAAEDDLSTSQLRLAARAQGELDRVL